MSIREGGRFVLIFIVSVKCDTLKLKSSVKLCARPCVGVQDAPTQTRSSWPTIAGQVIQPNVTYTLTPRLLYTYKACNQSRSEQVISVHVGGRFIVNIYCVSQMRQPQT